MKSTVDRTAVFFVIIVFVIIVFVVVVIFVFVFLLCGKEMTDHNITRFKQIPTEDTNIVKIDAMKGRTDLLSLRNFV